jgi:predicted CopG family antitoxin
MSDYIYIDLRGPDGNAFAIIGICKNIYKQLPDLKKAMFPIENKSISDITNEMMSGDYENLLEVVDKYFGDFIEFSEC